MSAVADKCRCGLPLRYRDAKAGWYFCDHCDRPEQDPKHVPKDR